MFFTCELAIVLDTLATAMAFGSSTSRPPFGPPATAAALVIGNELLSGKIKDTNVLVLARALREQGVALRRVVFVIDDIDEIARETADLAARHDWVFTSGGVGPTHDDVTVLGVAQAFGLPTEESPTLVALLKEHYGQRCTTAHLRMALVPKDTVLETTESVRWPTLRCRNVWLLPGVPDIFSRKLTVALARMGRGVPFVSLAVTTALDEGHIKHWLDAIVSAFPDVDVGSYPRWEGTTYRTKLTFDGRDPERIREARDAFVALLPKGEAHPVKESS